MANFKIQGTLVSKSETVQVSDKFKKREFVIVDKSEMYPQSILIQLSQDKCDLLNGINDGQLLEVDFNLKGREWINPQGEKRYFNTIEAWRITALNGTAHANEPVKEYATKQANNLFKEDIVADLTAELDDSDLPF